MKKADTNLGYGSFIVLIGSGILMGIILFNSDRIHWILELSLILTLGAIMLFSTVIAGGVTMDSVIIRHKKDYKGCNCYFCK